MERFSNAADGGWQCKVDLSATPVDVSSEGTKHRGGCWKVKRLEDVFVEWGLCEAHVEGILSSNIFPLGGQENSLSLTQTISWKTS